MTTITLKLRSRLEVTHAKPDDIYDLLFYTSHGDNYSWLSFKRPHASTRGHPSTFEIATDVVRLPCSFNVWLFTTSRRDNKAGALVTQQTGFAFESLRAMTVTPEGNPKRLEIKDVEDSLQAVLLLEILESPIAPFISRIPSYPRITLINRYIDAVKGYQQQHLRFDREKDFFYAFASCQGDLPLIAFPILAHRVLRTYNEGVGGFLERLQSIALHISVSDDTTSYEDRASFYELLGMVCTLPSKALVYVPDQPRGCRFITDQYSLPGTFPHLGIAGYDCEDGGELALEIFTLFKHISFDNKYGSLTEASEPYTAFTVICMMKVKGEYIGHCTTCLLDSLYVDYLIGDSDREPRILPVVAPSQMLESVSSFEHVWCQDHWDEQRVQEWLESEHQSSRRLFHLFDHLPIVQFSARYKIPSLQLHHNGTYGNVVQMMTADHRGHSLSLILQQDGQLGIPWSQIALFEIKPQNVHVAIRLQENERKALDDELLEFPLSRLPQCQYRTVRPIRGNRYQKQGIMVMRTVDFMDHEKEIKRKLTNAKWAARFHQMDLDDEQDPLKKLSFTMIIGQPPPKKGNETS